MTLPPIISGYPVKDEISIASILFSLKCSKVPPVEIISTFSFCRELAKSIMPVLSETLNKALLIFIEEFLVILYKFVYF